MTQRQEVTGRHARSVRVIQDHRRHGRPGDHAVEHHHRRLGVQGVGVSLAGRHQDQPVHALRTQQPQVRLLTVGVLRGVAQDEREAARPDAPSSTPRTTDVKKGLPMSGVTSAIVWERRVLRERDRVRLIAQLVSGVRTTRARSSSETTRVPLRTCETVLVDTPASRATSRAVATVWVRPLRVETLAQSSQS